MLDVNSKSISYTPVQQTETQIDKQYIETMFNDNIYTCIIYMKETKSFFSMHFQYNFIR